MNVLVENIKLLVLRHCLVEKLHFSRGNFLKSLVGF